MLTDRMRMFLAIPLLMLISFSGIRFSYSTHFCRGIFIESSFSLSGEQATCGMENTADKSSTDEVLRNHCCDNVNTSFSIFNNYISESKLVVEKELATSVFVNTSYTTGSLTGMNELPFSLTIRPPGACFPNSLSIQTLCVFRI